MEARRGQVTPSSSLSSQVAALDLNPGLPHHPLLHEHLLCVCGGAAGGLRGVVGETDELDKVNASLWSTYCVPGAGGERAKLPVSGDERLWVADVVKASLDSGSQQAGGTRVT